MDMLKKDNLNIKKNLIEPRNITLGSNNNVLQPNLQKSKITDRMVKDNREIRVNNITTGIGSFKTGWINKNK